MRVFGSGWHRWPTCKLSRSFSLSISHSVDFSSDVLLQFFFFFKVLLIPCRSGLRMCGWNGWGAGEKATAATAAGLWGSWEKERTPSSPSVAPCFVLCTVAMILGECCLIRKLDRCTVFFVFLGWDGQTDVLTWRFPGRRGVEGIFGLNYRETTTWKNRGKETKKWVRRRGNVRYGLTKNFQNGCPPLMLTSQRDSVDLPAERGKRREILTPILSMTFLTDSQRSPIHPATHMLTISYTHIHPHAQTHCLTGQCGFGFKCRLHFSSFPDMFSANHFFQMLLEMFYKTKILSCLYCQHLLIVFGCIWFSYPGVIQMQIEVFFSFSDMSYRMWRSNTADPTGVARVWKKEEGFFHFCTLSLRNRVHVRSALEALGKSGGLSYT